MRIDIYLVKKGIITSREKAKEAVVNGEIMVGGSVVTKPSFVVNEGDEVSVKEVKRYVSRGAHKLLRAKSEFDFEILGKVVMDMGASTGGFTQVALESGASKVYSVDVGRGELATILREDARVVNMENTDIRALTADMCKDVQLVVGDLSFISLRHILPKLKDLFGKPECVLLFKPQFECGANEAKKYKGVVLDKKLHIRLLEEFAIYVKGLGFELSELTYSDLRGKEGNIEYLVHLNGLAKKINIVDIVENAFNALLKKQPR